MRLRLPFLFAAFALLPGGQAYAQKKLLSLEQVSGRGESVSFSGRAPAWSWASDGVHLIQGSGTERQWIDPRTWQVVEPPAGAADAAERRPSGRGRGGAGSGGGARESGREFETPSPDGRYLAYVEGNDLKLLEVASGDSRALTSSGGPDLFNGKLDWVYQEEIYGRGNFQAFWWSPDSAAIAFLSLDQSQVHPFTVVDHLEDGHFRVTPEVTKYPKAGDPNPVVKLGVAAAAAGTVQWIDLSSYPDPEQLLIVRVEWRPDGRRLLFLVQDRIQSWLDLNAADPDTGEWTTLIHETSDSWVERSRPPRWLADGSFLWLSQRSGHRHLYHYRPDGELIRAVTQGDWSVQGLEHVDEARGLVWFTANEGGAVNANGYRVGLDGGGLRRLTQGDGQHAPSFNADRSLFLDVYSSLSAPPAVRLCSGEGEVLRELGRAEIPAVEEYWTSAWELHQVPARDGFLLDVALLKPVPFEAGRAYPVWLPTYSGPNSPSVQNAWNGGAYHQFLAQQGIIVLQVNVRSASGKSHAAASRCYRRLGAQELADLEDAVAWLTAHPWADEQRVGIGGHSYGGFMAAYALTHSDAFALGVAGSGVYDWRMYDTVYTERYMSTPQLNPEGYAQSSVIQAAGNLHGHLVLTHGTLDDNVHLQNALQLAYALQKAGKRFEMMLYPESRHGIRDPDLRWHARRLEWEAIGEHLRPPGPPPRGEAP